MYPLFFFINSWTISKKPTLEDEGSYRCVSKGVRKSDWNVRTIRIIVKKDQERNQFVINSVTKATLSCKFKFDNNKILFTHVSNYLYVNIRNIIGIRESSFSLYSLICLVLNTYLTIFRLLCSKLFLLLPRYSPFWAALICSVRAAKATVHALKTF